MLRLSFLTLLLPVLASAEITVDGPVDRTGWFRDNVPRLLREVERGLGFAYEGAVHVRLARSDAEFARIAGDLPSWVAAVAHPRDASLIVSLPAVHPSRGTDIASVLRHEIVHVVLPARTGRRARIPRWFEEGLAQVVGGRLIRVDVAGLPVTAAAGRLIPLREIADAFPRSQARAALAYAQGESVVTFLTERHGPDGIRRLLDGIRETASFEVALRREYDLDTAGLEERWKEWIEEEGDPWWVALILPAFLPLLFFVASLLAVAAYLRSRRRGRKTYESLPE